MNDYNIIIILGPTASGKTKLAAHIAAYFNSEIISADSRQVYRDMNLGTGKDYNEYIINENPVPYHLIDLVDAGAHYDINQYILDFRKIFEAITLKNIIPVLCGGSPLYIYALLRGFDYTAVPVNLNLRDNLMPLTHQELQNRFAQITETDFHRLADLSTKKRCIRAIEIATYLAEGNKITTDSIKLNPLIIGLNLSAEERKIRIQMRVGSRLQQGMIDEVKQLLEKGITPEKLIFYGLEYKFITQFLMNEISFEMMKEKLVIAIQQFSKRQMTFYRKMEREGYKIHWIDAMQSFESIYENTVSIIKGHNR